MKASGILVILTAALAAQPAAACTVAVFGPAATKDGRPMLWKNRDVDNPDQEVRYFDDGRYRFVANTYAGETTKVWAGINEAGFAIMNSDAHNMRGRDGDDGLTMKAALATCASVGDFAKLMDSINKLGRSVTANFGVFDSTGMTSIFEAANTFYVRYDASDDSLGLIVRANYAMAGDTNRLLGKERFERAMELVRAARAENRITVEFVIRELARDIGAVGFDPYPLPYEGVYGGLPFGYLPITGTVCRTSTRSVEIMVGPRPGEPVNDGMMWMMLGAPDAVLPVPLWVAGGPVPELLDGPVRSRICDEAKTVRDYILASPDYPSAANTYCMYAVGRHFAPVETTILDLVGRAEAEWAGTGPDSAAAASITAEVSERVLDAYLSFWNESGRPGSTEVSRPSPAPSLTGRYLEIRLPPGSSRARVYDAQGRLVATVVSPERGGLVRWNADRLRAGSYFIGYPDDPGVSPARFIRVP